MASQTFKESPVSLPGGQSAVDNSHHGRYPFPQFATEDPEYREVNVDQLSESDFDGMRDSGLAYSDHDYMGSNPTPRCLPEMCQFPVLGCVSDQYLSGESNNPCAERTDTRVGVANTPSGLRKGQLLGTTQIRTAKGTDLATIGASPFPAVGKSVSWKNLGNITQPKKSGRPPKNEVRDLPGDRLMGRAMVKAGIQGHMQQQILHPQSTHAMQDFGLNMQGAAPLVTPARGQKITPRGRSAAGQRREISDDGNGGFMMLTMQQGAIQRSASVSSSKKQVVQFRTAQAAEDAHTREMMEAAQNALAPSNATISGHSVLMNAQPQHHPIVVPVQQPQHQLSHVDDEELPRTPGKGHTYSPHTSPASITRRTLSESQDMSMHLLQEPHRMNPDGLPVTPGGNRKTANRSSTPRSRISISESTGSHATSPQRQYMVSPSRQMLQGRAFTSPLRQTMKTLKSPPTGTILSVTQGPSTMASAQMQMSYNAPMPSLHNQTYQTSSVVSRQMTTSPTGRPYFDVSDHAAPLITGSGSNAYNPRRRKDKEADEALEAEVTRNVKTILQADATHRLSTASSHTLSPRNETSEDDSIPRGTRKQPSQDKKRSTNKRRTHKQSKNTSKQWSSENSEGDDTDWLVSCICGQTEDDGEAMVGCDRCERWEHVDCIFPRTKKAPDGSYTCHTCAPRATELTPQQARDYQNRVMTQKEKLKEAEVKKKLEERAKKKEENSRKQPTPTNRAHQLKGSWKGDKSTPSNYREIDRNEYSANAKRLLTVSRQAAPTTDPEILKILKDNPRARHLIVEPSTYGLFTMQDVSNGAFIVELCGNVSLEKDWPNREGTLGSWADSPLAFFFEKDDSRIIIDARKSGNFARHVRRSCKPNAELQEIVCGSELHVMIKATESIKNMEEVTIGLQPDWRKRPRSAQGCTCKEENLKTCEVEQFFKRKGKNMGSSSRRSVPVTTTPKAGTLNRRAVTEKKRSGSDKNVISKKGKKKSTIKLPRHIRKSVGGSASTADDSEGDDSEMEYEESIEDSKNKEIKITKRGRKNTAGSSDVRKEEQDMAFVAATRSSARIRYDSEMKKEESPIKKEYAGDHENVVGESKKGVKTTGKEKDSKEVKEEISTPAAKKERKPWPTMDYSLPSERNKPTREERKFQAFYEQMEKINKKRESSARGRRPSTATPSGDKNAKSEKSLSSGKGKRKFEKEDESAPSVDVTAASASTSTPVLEPGRNILNAAGVGARNEGEMGSSPSWTNSQRDSRDIPARSPVPSGGTKKRWLQRHQEEQAAAAIAAVEVEAKPASTPTRSKRTNKKEDKGAGGALVDIRRTEEEESIRDEMRRNAINLRNTLLEAPFCILKAREEGDIAEASGSGASCSTPRVPPTPTPVERAKDKKKITFDEYRKRKQTGESVSGTERRDESEKKQEPPKKSFMPSADAIVPVVSLPHMKLPELDESVGMDELSRRVYGDKMKKEKKEGASSSTGPPMGKMQPTPKRPSINERLKNEFALPILSSPHLSITSTTSTAAVDAGRPSISPIPTEDYSTPASGRTHKHRLSDARSFNVEPPGVIGSPRLASAVPLPTPPIPSNAAFIHRAASVRSSHK